MVSSPPGSQKGLHSGSVVLVAAVGVILAVSVISVVTANQRAAPPSAPRNGTPVAGAATSSPRPFITHHVRYEVSGGAALNITYVIGSSEIAQVAESPGPWSVSIERVAPAGTSLYYSLSAQDAGQGTLRCRVLIDGVVQSDRAVEAPNRVVRCSGTLP